MERKAKRNTKKRQMLLPSERERETTITSGLGAKTRTIPTSLFPSSIHRERERAFLLPWSNLQRAKDARQLSFSLSLSRTRKGQVDTINCHRAAFFFFKPEKEKGAVLCGSKAQLVEEGQGKQLAAAEAPTNKGEIQRQKRTKNFAEPIESFAAGERERLAWADTRPFGTRGSAQEEREERKRRQQ